MALKSDQALARVSQQYRLIHDIYVQLDDGDRRVLQVFGLTISQFAVLSLLDPEEGKRPIDLSGKLLRARSTVTRLIDQMEEMGLVRRIADPEDRRAQLVVLTPKGVSLLDQARDAHEDSLMFRLDRMDAGAQRQLNRLLDELRHHLGRALEED